MLLSVSRGVKRNANCGKQDFRTSRLRDWGLAVMIYVFNLLLIDEIIDEQLDPILQISIGILDGILHG